MLIHLCGVRGSTPAPGADFVRYGGHTSCVAIAREGDDPTLVLDAGTGIRNLSRILEGRPFRGAVLLGHLHWDHTHGLPFFRAGDRPDSDIDLYLPAQGDDAEATLARGMSPPNFPIRPSELRGEWRFHPLEEGTHVIAGFEVLAREVPHKGGRTFGYRVSDGDVSVTYISDHHPSSLGAGPEGFGPYHPAVRELAEGADVLLHDAQYTADEFPERAAFGHSAVDYVLGLGEICRVDRVVLFHHDPARTDDELDAIAEEACGTDGRVSVAAEMGTIAVTSSLRSRPAV